jgi:hypothetical protein
VAPDPGGRSEDLGDLASGQRLSTVVPQPSILHIPFCQIDVGSGAGSSLRVQGPEVSEQAESA